MTALVIEDQEEEADMIANIICPLATKVIVRHRMAEALVDIGMAGPPEIICVDLGLPDSLRDFTINTRIPQIRQMAANSLILVLTGMCDEEDEKKCIQNGADAVFNKLDVNPSRGFMDALRLVVIKLMRTPRNRTANLRILETVAKRLVELTQQ